MKKRKILRKNLEGDGGGESHPQLAQTFEVVKKDIDFQGNNRYNTKMGEPSLRTLKVMTMQH